MTYLESAYRHQAIVFRRFSDKDGITIRKMLENLGLRDIQLISNDLDRNIFEIINVDNPEAKAICVDYKNPENGKIYTVSLFFQPIEKTDGSLYIRVTYTKPGDVADDRKTVFSKSEPMVVSLMVVYDFQDPEGKTNALASLSKSIDAKLEKGEGQLTKEDFEFIRGCYELDRMEKYMNDGQFYFDRNRWNDAILQFVRVFLMLNTEIQKAAEKDRLQYAMVCMYLAKCYEQKGILSKAMYYINLAKSMDYIYETDADIMRRNYEREVRFSTGINIGYILNSLLDIDAHYLGNEASSTISNTRNISVISLKKSASSADRSQIADNGVAIISSNLVKDTEGQDVVRVDITLPHYAMDNDKFSDEKYNIPANATFVLSPNYQPNPELKAENMNAIISDCEALAKDKFYVEALLRAEFAVSKLKNTYTRDPERKANYTKALTLMTECCNRLALNEKAVFYASLLKDTDPENGPTAYAHCLIDAQDPRALAAVNASEEKTAKMQLFLKRQMD